MFTDREKKLVALFTGFLSAVALVVMIFLPEPAEAQFSSAFPRVYGDVLDNVNLNSNQSVVIPLDQGRYTALQLGFRHINAAADRLDVTTECQMPTDNYYNITAREISGGVSTSAAFSDQFAVNSNTNFRLTYGVEGCKRARVTVAGNNANTNDLLFLEATATQVD